MEVREWDDGSAASQLVVAAGGRREAKEGIASGGWVSPPFFLLLLRRFPTPHTHFLPAPLPPPPTHMHKGGKDRTPLHNCIASTTGKESLQGKKVPCPLARESKGPEAGKEEGEKTSLNKDGGWDRRQDGGGNAIRDSPSVRPSVRPPSASLRKGGGRRRCRSVSPALPLLPTTSPPPDGLLLSSCGVVAFRVTDCWGEKGGRGRDAEAEGRGRTDGGGAARERERRGRRKDGKGVRRGAEEEERKKERKGNREE